MGKQERRAIDTELKGAGFTDTGLNFDQVDWDRYIKRWLLYAHRYIPSHACVDALSAEDAVFQAIDAVISGRRVYARPNIFADSCEPDHQAPFFVYMCGVIRANVRSCYQRDSRYTPIHNLIEEGDSDNVGNDSRELLIDSNHCLETLEQEQQLDLFKNYLCRTTNDPILLKITDSLLCPQYAAFSAEQKAAEFGVDISTFNNALKRFKRILKKFSAHQSRNESTSATEAGRE